MDHLLMSSVMLLDIQMPGQSGIEGIPAIKKLRPGIDIIMFTTFEESEKIFAAFKLFVQQGNEESDI